MNKEYVLAIGDDQYRVVTDEEEALLKKAAERVHGAMVQILGFSPTVTPKKAAVLAALQFVNEMQKLEMHHGEISRTCQRLLDGLDTMLVEK